MKNCILLISTKRQCSSHSYMTHTSSVIPNSLQNWRVPRIPNFTVAAALAVFPERKP